MYTVQCTRKVKAPQHALAIAELIWKPWLRTDTLRMERLLPRRGKLTTLRMERMAPMEPRGKR